MWIEKLIPDGTTNIDNNTLETLAQLSITSKDLKESGIKGDYIRDIKLNQLVKRENPKEYRVTVGYDWQEAVSTDESNKKRSR